MVAVVSLYANIAIVCVIVLKMIVCVVIKESNIFSF